MWIVSFVAFFGSESLSDAARQTGFDPNTVRDHVRDLEVWLRRPLMDESKRIPYPTLQAAEFYPIASEILEWLVRGGLLRSIERSQITPDAIHLRNGERRQTPEAYEAAKLLIKFRGSLIGAKPAAPEPKVSGASINMDWFDG